MNMLQDSLKLNLATLSVKAMYSTAIFQRDTCTCSLSVFACICPCVSMCVNALYCDYTGFSFLALTKVGLSNHQRQCHATNPRI